MKNFSEMLKKAQTMQAKMQEMQDDLENLVAEGQSGAGMVQITVNGKGYVKGLKIDPSLMKADEVEILEDLITAAYADARGKADEQAQEKMAELTQGLNLPGGMKLPF